MMGFWVLFVFIIPAAILQWVSIEKPTNLMIDIIDVKRDKTSDIYNQSTQLKDKQLFNLYPSLKSTEIAKDSILIKGARRSSIIALVNEAMKEAIAKIESDHQTKNEIIVNTYWFNPVTYSQNKLNQFSKTHFNDYESYREDIQKSVDKRIKIMVLDIWNNVKVDKAKYLSYFEILN